MRIYSAVTMRLVAIILLCMVAAVAYGVIHDQITARICIEYFTIGHPPVFPTTDPTLLGLGWGILATWWVGLLLGVPLACVARIGSRRKLTASQLLRPIAVLMVSMGIVAVVAGTIGHLAASRHWVWLVEPLASRVPPERHVAFLTALWAHLASYASGVLGGIILCIRVFRRRCRIEAATPQHADHWS